MKLTYLIKPPCLKCPYKLGFIHTLINPCPQCKENGYKTFEQFQRHLYRDYSVPKNEGKKKL